MKGLYKSILIISVVFLASCAKYQHYFGGKSGDYSAVETTNRLQYPAGVSALQASDRYNIPAIKATENLVELTPPDYKD